MNKASQIGKTIQIIRSVERGYIRFALFDFDGTLSLIREGWQDVMIPMMVNILLQCPNKETNRHLNKIVSEFVTRLTGRQTIYQMIRLCEEIVKCGGTPKDPLEYKYEYLDLLSTRIQHRIQVLKNKIISPDDLMVPGARKMLQYLSARKVICFLASGTDEKFVLEESVLLGIESYFQEIFGAKDDYKNFSKKKLINNMIEDHQLKGREFVTFGDGFVEIEDTKAVGGIAVGIASNEATRKGIDQWKRKRLIEAGADIITPDFCEHKLLSDYLLSTE
jgi:phosphoglycolate phosphatase